MAQSQKRIWLVAPQALDAETLAALTVAEYRKLDVRLLHRFPIYKSQLRNARQGDTLPKWLMLSDRQWFAWNNDTPTTMNNDEKRWLLEKFGVPVPSGVATGHNQKGSWTAQAGSEVFRYDRQQRVANDQELPRQLPKQPLYLRRQRESSGGGAVPLFNEKVLSPPTAVEPWIKSMNGPECY